MERQDIMTEPTVKQQCKDCLYYQSKGGSNGFCCRYPPRVAIVASQVTHHPQYDTYGYVAKTEWPAVEGPMFCGEYNGKA